MEFGAEKMVDALDHVADDFPRGVPDAEFLAQLGIEGFEEGLIKVLDGVFLTEGCEEVRLNPVEGVGAVIEDFGDLYGVQRAAFGHSVKECAKDGDTQVIGRETPIEHTMMSGIIGRTTPQNPGGEDAVKKCLDEGRAEEVFALFSFEGDTERFLQGGLDAVEGDDGMFRGALACFACVGGEKFGDIPGLFQRNFAGEDAGEEVGEGFCMALRESSDGKLPEVVGGEGKVIAFHDGRLTVAEFDELELVVVGDEAKAIFTQIAADLLRLGERVEGLAWRFDFDGSAFGSLVG